MNGFAECERCELDAVGVLCWSSRLQRVMVLCWPCTVELDDEECEPFPYDVLLRVLVWTARTTGTRTFLDAQSRRMIRDGVDRRLS